MTVHHDYSGDRCALGMRLRAARLAAGRTQAQLGRDLDLTVAYVSKVERGAVNVSRCVVLAWALVTESPVESFTAGSKNACTTSAPASAA